MVTPIYPETLLAIFYSKSGSDIHSIKERLVGRVLDNSNAFRGYSGPEEVAAHIFCIALSRANEKIEYKDESSVRKAVNDTLQIMAHDYYKKRIRFNIPGDEQSDWNHALDRFAEGCFNVYFAPERELSVAA